MAELNTNSCLKVKRDTFYLPDPQGGVYFRNNQSSFRLEGGTIYQWIEKLMPMFNGEQSLERITEGLTPPYRKRVYEIGETLYKNGFVRDVSQDHPHQLNSNILKKYTSQIEFIESFVDSGPYRFQQYRQAKVLAVGSGSFLVSLADALLESGLPKFHFMMTDSVPTNEVRIHELVQNARNDDSEVMVEQIPYHVDDGNFWQEAVKPYDWILYISQDGNEKELRELNRVCKEERKVFVPAICLDQVGLAGPVVHPESEGCWESAWRRIHQSSLQLDRQQPSFSGTAGAILAHVMVFEFFKRATDIADSNQSTKIYNLDLETLEGDWISFIPHPLVANYNVSPRLVEVLDVGLEQGESEKDPNHNLLEYFNLITSVETGIFHIWEERDLKQLPLSQCYVQAVNPVSEGPATLLPEVICTGLTHEEARREAGLKGIEMYVSQMIEEFTDRKNNVNVHNRFMGVGAGETIQEAVCRGLQAYIDEELRQRKANDNSTIFQIPLGTIEDQQCRIYLNALTTLNGAPTIGLKEDILGFPVIGVRSNGRWYTRAGLNTALALRYSLQQALLDAQNDLNGNEREMESAVFLKEKKFKLDIPSYAEITQLELLQSSLQVLNRKNKQLFIYDLAFESFLKQELAGVYGVQVREGES
ncbi:putative thiazole-containing bacteriocin maturation protein [Neobacillus sp. NRS-1170]|uniref:putative thiazole-containing bacteriocin maturation protein n=1 Tax=Neobacillus sp. NRS-1170 TaxID=3233898 RepID=UPI003D287960